MRARFISALLLLTTGFAHAATDTPTSAEFAAATQRETVLAAGMALMMALGLASFFLEGRIAERTQSGLALLGVLVGGFCLFVLYGLIGSEYPAAGALVVIGLIGMFKLMNQFEMRRKPAARQDRASD